jgi:hypothetical protein
VNCGRRGETSLIVCRSWPAGLGAVYSKESVDTLSGRPVASCWGPFELVVGGFSSSWRMSRLAGAFELMSLGSLSRMEAIASGDGASIMMPSEAEVDDVRAPLL